MKLRINILLFFHLLFFHLLFSAIAVSQKSSTFTLNDCIGYSLKNSPGADIAKQQFLQREYRYESFKAGYLPQFSLGSSGPGLNRTIGEILQPDGSIQFLPQSQLFANSSLSMRQLIPWTGGEITMSSGISRIDILERNEDFYWRTTPFQLNFSQPVFQHNSMDWDIKMEELNKLNSDSKYIEAMENVSIDITRKFFDLYIAEITTRNARKNVAINDTLFRISKGRFTVGKIAENDLLQNELGLMNAMINLENASLDYQKAHEELIIALGMGGRDNIVIIPPKEIPGFAVDADKALAMAIEKNSAIIDYEIESVQAGRSLDLAENSNDFSATITASFGLNQTAGNVPDSYRDLLDQERFNINFAIPVYQWGMGNAEVESAIANQRSVRTSVELRRRRFEMNVKYQVQNFKLLQKQVSVAAKADTIAARRFDLAKNRYMIGKIDMNTFFIAQNEKDNALRAYITTLRDFWVAYYRLRQMTLYDFEQDKAIRHR